MEEKSKKICVATAVLYIASFLMLVAALLLNSGISDGTVDGNMKRAEMELYNIQENVLRETAIIKDATAGTYNPTEYDIVSNWSISYGEWLEEGGIPLKLRFTLREEYENVKVWLRPEYLFDYFGEDKLRETELTPSSDGSGGYFCEVPLKNISGVMYSFVVSGEKDGETILSFPISPKFETGGEQQ